MKLSEIGSILSKNYPGEMVMISIHVYKNRNGSVEINFHVHRHGETLTVLSLDEGLKMIKGLSLEADDLELEDADHETENVGLD